MSNNEVSRTVVATIGIDGSRNFIVEPPLTDAEIRQMQWAGVFPSSYSVTNEPEPQPEHSRINIPGSSEWDNMRSAMELDIIGHKIAYALSFKRKGKVRLPDQTLVENPFLRENS